MIEYLVDMLDSELLPTERDVASFRQKRVLVLLLILPMLY